MKGLRQGLCSTKEKVEMENDKHPKEAIKKEHDVYVKVLDLKETIYTNQTGQFPFTSSEGNRYIMVAIHVDASYIFMEQMKNRTAGYMVETYQKIYGRMTDAFLGVEKYYLDNEASEEYKTAIKKKNAEWKESHLPVTDATSPGGPSKLPRTILFPY